MIYIILYYQLSPCTLLFTQNNLMLLSDESIEGRAKNVLVNSALLPCTTLFPAQLKLNQDHFE